MATILREWSYRYPWLYNAVSWIAAISVGGETKLRRIAVANLKITSDMQVLDLCCGGGQTTHLLVAQSNHVTGLDASPQSIDRAAKKVPSAQYVQGWAEAMPFECDQFDLVHTSLALHEMRPVQLWRVLQEVHRVLKPGGIFALVDFHASTHLLYGSGLHLFLSLFETETAQQFIKTDLADLLTRAGFEPADQRLYAGESLQVIQACKKE